MVGTDVQTTATFVQAAAAVLALVIATAAIIIPAVQQHRRATATEKEALLKAKCLATAIRFELHELLVALSGLNLKATRHLADLSAAGGIARSSGSVTQEVLAAKIETPPTLAASGERV